MRTVLLAAAAALFCAQAAPAAEGEAMVKVEEWGSMPDGQQVHLYTVENARGARMRVTDYGGIIVGLEMPDMEGKIQDITLGFNSLDAYLEGHPYFGAVAGRFANRIAEGKFSLDGEAYQLPTNDGPNHLHGGEVGFDKRMWTAEPFENEDGAGVKLHYTSPAGEQGYPGTLEVDMTYTLTNDNALRIDYNAETDAPTIVNLTHHSYFNLDGEGSGDILDTILEINADAITPVNDTLIPTGEFMPVEDTPFDFREPHAIGARIEAEHVQLERGGGYDHNFVLNDSPTREVADAHKPLHFAARATDPDSGRIMEVWTTEPGLQFYSGNFLDGTLAGKSGKKYEFRHGFCLETHHFPDSPNQPNFPSVVLRPGETYQHTTVYDFDTK